MVGAFSLSILNTTTQNCRTDQLHLFARYREFTGYYEFVPKGFTEFLLLHFQIPRILGFLSKATQPKCLACKNLRRGAPWLLSRC